MMNEARNKKDENQHIQVFVRIRPINATEKIGKSCSVVESSNKEIMVREKSQGSHSKKFTFNKVFGPSSKQIDVYNAVVNPLLEEVLAGYSCTVFAYGQTGTGKTFTMEGLSINPTLHWQSDTTAGIIPRALSHLFDELRMLEGQEYIVRVSFLELYNEEIFDLLSSNDDASKIRLYEDATRKGSVIIHGLKEVIVHDKNEVYKILEKGSEKRQTAATLMNAHSSRSHTVFSITIHIKENNIDGEELLKTGKLNLVDLAGSENIGRSGAVDRRAREAGNINQSLLTLRRVITALVERAPHIPYRESKLTRLLQESLGGRTKTSIIATVSAANINLEETLSTLNYAHRAKNITNRPEINKKLSKKAVLKEYTEEIERLRRDLIAARERSGVYLALENYNEMILLIENQNKEIEEKIIYIKVLKETMEAKEQIFNDLQVKHEEQTNRLHETKEQLETITYALKSATARLEMTEREKEEQCHLVEKHVSTEKQLSAQAQILLNVADTVTTDVNKLQDKISYKRQLEQENEHLGHQFQCNMAKQFQDMENNIALYSQNFLQFCTSMKSEIDSQVKLFKKDIDSLIHHVSNDIINKEQSIVDEFTKNINISYTRYQQWLNAEKKYSSDLIQHEQDFLNDTSLKLTSKINELIEINNLQIANTLHQLNDDVSKKFEKLLEYTDESIRQLCDRNIHERDNLCKNMDDMRKNIKIVHENESKIMEEQERFKKLFENLCLQFNNFNKNVTENHSNTCTTLARVNEICDNMDTTILDNYHKFVDGNESLKEKIQNNIDILKSKNINRRIIKNQVIAKKFAEEGHNLTDEFQSNINNHCDALMQNKLHIEDDKTQMEQQFLEDNSSSIGFIENIHHIIKERYDNYIKLVNEAEQRKLQMFINLSDEIKKQNKISSGWNDKTATELHLIQDRIGKFLLEDLRRDTPTGLTPAKKEYHYPRRLVITSPHERILQRFRERRSREKSDDEDTILIDNNTSK
ncbi:kinesin-like protein Klp61F isoform X2 [Anoplolepis gracilipes]|uniref:kinesin-like protein Klp61F isoform X2 n=1 Tax=Anoplolepis gracilipes TaxID=354296 RepID=UPI003B9FAF1C